MIDFWANEFQRCHPRKLCANRLPWKAGKSQNLIATSATKGYSQQCSASVDGFELCHISTQKTMSSLYENTWWKELCVVIEVLVIFLQKKHDDLTRRGMMSWQSLTRELSIVDQMIREHTIKPKHLWERRCRRMTKSILHRFQTQESYRNSKTHIRWTEEFCKHLDELAGDDHSYVATRCEERDTRKHGRWIWTAKETLQLQFSHEPTITKHWQDYVKWKRKHLRQGTTLIPSFDPIFKSDSAKGNSSSQVMNLPQVTSEQVQPIIIHHARGNLLRALSIKVRTALIGGNIPIPGRHLPIHGGHQQDGKRGECAFKKIAYKQ